MNNRIIKFRVWSDNKMEYDIFQIWSDASNPREYMQYTGLKDKNGKEIYEGDIVCDPSLNDENKHWQVPELPRLFHLYGESVFNPENCEVIGNIYENPELLTSKE